MSNRINSYAGLEWLRFLVEKRLIPSGNHLLPTITTMADSPDFFRLDERDAKTVAEWDAIFGFGSEN